MGRLPLPNESFPMGITSRSGGVEGVVVREGGDPMQMWSWLNEHYHGQWRFGTHSFYINSASFYQPQSGNHFLHYLSEIMESLFIKIWMWLEAASMMLKGVKAPIVIFIPLFHSNALLRWTALLFTPVKNAVFASNSTKCQNDTFLTCTKQLFITQE